jgi:hypothetical protein
VQNTDLTRNPQHSDVLARHTKGCDAARTAQYGTFISERAKRTRVKRACDRCARLKVKCDYESPCQRCAQKELSCTTSRDIQVGEGQREPTAAFPTPTPDIIISPVQTTLYQMPDPVMVIDNGHRSIETTSTIAAGPSHSHDSNISHSGFGTHDINPASAWNLWADGSLQWIFCSTLSI